MEKTSRHDIKSTVFMSPEQRKVIEKSGKTVQQFFTDLLDVYIRHNMDKWSQGHLYHRDARVVFLRADSMNRLLQLLPNPYKAGRMIGERAREVNLAIYNIDGTEPAGRDTLLQILGNLRGWGVITYLKPNKFVLESPALSNEAFVRGYLEGVMAARFRTIYADVDRMAFERVRARRQGKKR